MYICIYICIYMCVYICIYTYMYLYPILNRPRAHKSSRQWATNCNIVIWTLHDMPKPLQKGVAHRARRGAKENHEKKHKQIDSFAYDR